MELKKVTKNLKASTVKTGQKRGSITKGSSGLGGRRRCKAFLLGSKAGRKGGLSRK